jgi:hypothetical protein
MCQSEVEGQGQEVGKGEEVTTMTFKRLIPILLACGISALLLVGASSAFAAGPTAGWSLRSDWVPTNFPAKPTVEPDGFFVTATSVGTGASGPVVIKDTLPPGVELFRVEEARASEPEPLTELGGGLGGGEGMSCTSAAQTVTCAASFSELYGGSLKPGGTIQILLTVTVTPQAASTVLNHAELEEEPNPGGEPGRKVLKASTEAPSTTPTPVNGETAKFGIQNFSAGVSGPAGEHDVQAGGHPAAVETSIAYNTLDEKAPNESVSYVPVQEPKVTNVSLPMGFIGNALAAPKCTEVELAAESACPPDTRVGDVGVFLNGARNNYFRYIYNITPEPGYPAEFGFILYRTAVIFRPRLLPSKNGYVLSVAVPAVPRSENTKLHEVSVTFFGDPGVQDGGSGGEAFATNPQSCGSGPADATLEMNSWEAPGNWQLAESPMYQGSSTQGVTGCEGLQFSPSVKVAPETTQADTPSGYEVDLKVPQTPDIEGDLATPDLKNAVVSLPEGVSVDPSAANGLTACQVSGPEGIELGNQDTPTADQAASAEGAKEGQPVQEGEVMGADGLVHPAAGHCPASSQVGEVEVTTPLLEAPLKGHVYVATPGCGGAGQSPCTAQSAEDGELFGIYLEIAGSGVIVKLKGEVSVNPQTGRLTTRFTEAPQLPFSELKLRLNGGARAPLANPQSCGMATSTSDLTPWSTPYTPDATPFSSFAVSGCGGGFGPSFSAGTVSSAAGAYSPFTLTFSRHDGEQDLSGLTVNMPLGLIGKIAGFAQCGEAEANAGTCPAASRVGTATAAAGAGSSPFWQSGPVYLTGPYNGAPFGLSVVVPANAGPYHLGNIVVRAAIHINPATAQVTVVSNPLPQMIDGVPLRVQTVNVTVGEGDNFTFNPTSCSSQSITAAISSAEGASVGVSSPFQATGCANLPFKPSLTAATVGKASKAGGASLDVKVASGAGQANVAKIDLELPKQLPARLTTLQKACLASVFEANPASCPTASDIGSATVSTPLLSNPLSGPMYLVSHGGEAFPDVEIVLQGEGVRLIVDGKTQIKGGITYNHFETIPDAPFTSFEAKLPTGKYSIFGTNLPEKAKYNLCGQSLSMPTEIVGQNGAVIKQTTKVGVTGCPKAKKASKPKKKAKAEKSAKATGRDK